MKAILKVSLMILIALSVVPTVLHGYPVDQDGKSPFVQVIKDKSDAVVQIKVEGEVQAQMGVNSDLFRFFYPYQEMPQTRPFTSMGSGFIIKFDTKTKEAFIVTNNHVVEKGETSKITVTLADKKKYEAEVVGTDPKTDLAVIKIKVDPDEKIISMQWGNSETIDIGDWVIAIGNPFGDIGLDRTVTVGVVSAKGRSGLNFGQASPVYQDYIQTDASINPGNSGGPLLNHKGNVVGVNAAITSPNGGNIGIGFAIPSTIAEKVVSDIIESNSVKRAYLGISPQEIDDTLKETFELNEISGVLVAQVVEDTPADKAGLKRGDVILSIDGVKVPNVAKFRIAIAHRPIGVPVEFEIMRKNKSKTISAVLTEYPDSENTDDISPTTKDIAKDTGLEVVETDSEIGKKLKIESKEGVLISSVSRNSPADKAGLKPGEIILEINDVRIANVKDYTNTLNLVISGFADSKRKVILFYIADRNGNKRYVPIDMG
ncbi:MAG: trypsin-like peptidase domain-containing protein [Candidatus Cloacimonetes bacterium]|nr:trypsin-like peptidase domain-containing protein [Candidatus Cloacimonadota bacterium]